MKLYLHKQLPSLINIHKVCSETPFDALKMRDENKIGVNNVSSAEKKPGFLFSHANVMDFNEVTSNCFVKLKNAQVLFLCQ